MVELTPSDPVLCPACGKPYILVSSVQAQPDDPRGSHYLEYQHADGSRCAEPVKPVAQGKGGA
jgi:hypothetical protein